MTKISEQEKEVAAGRRRPGEEATDGSIWKAIDEIMSGVPEAALNRLPADGAERHDHYLHSTRGETPRES
jgi:hypothetical protein